ncbi:MAG TPA: hypothetical protein VE093_11220 [Polyangiaceae bacterium]|nr:hypothetical protein [Polyangiaceae bacterium]
MASRFEIYADEAWTHGGEPLRRYWCFYGGVFGTESAIGRLDQQLRAVKAAHKHAGEIKWNKLTPQKLPCYIAYVECLLSAIEAGHVRFRQMFHDRSHVRIPVPGEAAASDLDVQFKLCYQFIKHCFGIRYLEEGSVSEVLVRLDTHSSQKHRDRLEEFVKYIPHQFGRSDFEVKTTFHQSGAVPLIQVSDLMIGAAGSYGNKMHKLRDPGQRGMSPRQKARLALCNHIYNRLRAIDAHDRGSHGFNWFESTGFNGDRANLLHHKFRVWKFLPRQYQIDKGWQNDNLDKQGQYVKANIHPVVHSVGYNDSFDDTSSE